MKRLISIEEISIDKKDKVLDEIINICVNEEFYSDVARNITKLLVKNKIIDYGEE